MFLRSRAARWRALVLAAVVAAGAGYLALNPDSQPRAAAATGALTWSDDFDGPAGTAPNAGKWSHDVGGGGWGNSELEYYTNSTSNAALDGNGHLVITARKENPAGYSCWYGSCQYTSARLLTANTFSQAYGRFEARIQIPRGQGLWPAFWMLGNNIGSVQWPNSGEIDVMENVGKEPGTVHGSMHGPGYSGGNPLTGSYSLPGGQAFADGFHTFAADWSPTSVTFSVDGNAYETHTPADTNGNPWVFDHPFFILLNVAVGGTWPGSPDGGTSFPQQMIVDYVHVYAYSNDGGGGGSGATGQIVGMGGKCAGAAGGNTANGTAIDIYGCVGSSTQQWTMNANGTITTQGKCMDVAGGGTADGTKVQLYDCNGTPAQKWVYSSGHDLVNPQANKCLDITGNTTADFTTLQIWTCTGGANQKWTVPGA